MATLDNLEDWLIAIAQHTRETKEAVQGRTATPAGGGAGTNRALESMFDRLGQRLERVMQPLVGMGLGQAKALERRGFGGTLEQARMDYAMEQLGRQFAAVMKPVMDAMTYAAVQIERRMRGMGGAEQNRVMGGLLGAGLGFRYGGVGGALAGGILGSALMGGEINNPYYRAATIGSGAYMGYSMGGRMGAVAGAGITYAMLNRDNAGSTFGGMAAGAALGARLGPAGAVAGGAIGAVTGSPDSYRNETGTEYYNRMRASGSSVLGAYASGMGQAVSRWFGTGDRDKPADYAGREVGLGAYLAPTLDALKKRAAGGGSDRRDVTPFSAEQMDIGGTASKIQEGIIRATAGADFEENNPFKAVIDAILNKFDAIIRLLGGTVAPPPEAAAGARPA